MFGGDELRKVGRCPAHADGGGDALRALEGRYVQVLCGDAAELSKHLVQGAKVQLLASLSQTRLAGCLSGVPTAAEQGVHIHWPILRGVYASSDFPAAELSEVVRQMVASHPTKDIESRIRERSMQPVLPAGAPLMNEVNAQLQRYRAQAELFGLIKR